MKVCFLNHDLREDTGAGRFGRALMQCLRQAIPELRPSVLVAEGSGHPDELPLIAQNRLGLLKNLPAIRRAFRRCDLIHALDGWPYGAIAALAGRGLGRPLLITAIGTGAIQPLHRWSRPLLAWAYRRAERVVAISSYTRREIQARVAGLEIEVVNHAVDAAEFAGVPGAHLPPDEQAKIERWQPYLLSVGAPKARKGFEDSIRAFAALAGRFPNLRYVIVGSGGSFLRPLVAGLGLGERIVFLKGIPRPMLVALYRSAELFMLLPRDVSKDVEGFGFAFLDAAAAGIPVVGTRESGAEDAIADGGNGLLVPPGDAAAAAEAAAAILTDPARRQAFRAGSLDFARRMNWARVAGRYRAIYRELLEAGAG